MIIATQLRVRWRASEIEPLRHGGTEERKARRSSKRRENYFASGWGAGFDDAE